MSGPGRARTQGPRRLGVLALTLTVGLAAVALPVVAGLGGLELPWPGWPWKRKTQGLDPTAPVDPDRRYHLVVWDYRLPFTSPSGTPFSTATEEAIRRFTDRYPNVTVDLHLLDLDDGPSELAQALVAGYPPDVYCSPYGTPAVGSSLQVPVGLYLDASSWADYHPVAWQAVKVEGTVWAWPRWLLLWPWLGNRDLLEKAGYDPEQVSEVGWTREELTALGRRLAQVGTGGARTLAIPSPTVLLRDILFTPCLASASGGSPADWWAGPEPAAAVEWLDGLRESGQLLLGDKGTSPRVIEAFAEGRAAVLVPPSPWAALFLLEPVKRPAAWQFRLPSRAGRPELVLVPPPQDPAGTGRSLVWVSAATVAVFRHARYKGDDNTRLAVELARELTRGYRVWLRDQPLCVPARAGEVESWRASCERLGDAGAFAVRCFDALAALPRADLAAALTTLTYGPLVELVHPSTDAGLSPGPTYLGPFLAGLAETVEGFCRGQVPRETLITELGGRLSEPP
ncbi:MAG: extracellular solute-binding protein [Firmicutes bacterium]|nr:extracellular solute-binding protein [Bacillota bacterium]